MASKNIIKMEDIVADTSLTISHEGTTIVSGTDTLDILQNRYGEWLLEAVKQNEETPMETFLRIFTRWKVRNLENFWRMYEALHIEYNPLENYDRYEEGGWKDEGSVSRESSGNSISNATMLSGGSDTNKVSAFNSTEYQPSSKNENESSSSNDTSSEITGNESGESTTTHTFEDYHVHGNIGVKTNAAMGLEELDFRKHDLANDIIGQFVFMYCYLKDEE